MADPISLTAAGVGFVGFAGQLAQGIIKLREIYTSLHDAPKDVANLCLKMELLRGLLEETAHQIRQPNDVKIDTRAFKDVVAQCETLRYRLKTHVERIDNCMRKTRVAAIRYLVKKNAIQEMLSDVEQCKSSLVIARQSIDGCVTPWPVLEASS